MQKIKPHRSEKYLKWIRTQPCCHCGSRAEPHHIIAIGDGKTSGKASDLATMPLCRTCHSDVHFNPHAWPQAKWLEQTLNRAAVLGIIKVA